MYNFIMTFGIELVPTSLGAQVFLGRKGGSNVIYSLSNLNIIFLRKNQWPIYESNNLVIF